MVVIGVSIVDEVILDDGVALRILGHLSSPTSVLLHSGSATEIGK